MKFLFDLFPVILFFVSYQVAGGQPETATELANGLLGGGIAAQQAPILIATCVAIVATFAQIGWLLMRGRKVDTMLWVSLVLIVVFGGATIFFHDATFIKWKPTILYWLFSTSLLVSAVVFNKNLIRSFMEAQIKLPDDVWSRLNVAWIGFFAVMGFLNLYVAFEYPEATWVKFKLFGGMGLMFLFVIAQSMFLGKYVQEDKQ
jgi:intracellular septation protein